MVPVQPKPCHDTEACAPQACLCEVILYLSFIRVQLKYMLGGCRYQKLLSPVKQLGLSWLSFWPGWNSCSVQHLSWKRRLWLTCALGEVYVDHHQAEPAETVISVETSSGISWDPNLRWASCSEHGEENGSTLPASSCSARDLPFMALPAPEQLQSDQMITASAQNGGSICTCTGRAGLLFWPWQSF